MHIVKKYAKLLSIVMTVSVMLSLIAIPAQAGNSASPLILEPNDTSMVINPTHAVAMSSNGTLWQWGEKDSLGLDATVGEDIYQNTPIQVPDLQNVKSLLTGFYSDNFALKNDGTVWSWGANYGNLLGIGSTDETLEVAKPQELNLNNVSALATNFAANYALKEDGTVWSWGTNYAGSLGNGSTDETLMSAVPGQVQGLDQIVALTDNAGSILALKGDGTVWGWGDNSAMQLKPTTDETVIPTPIQVAGLSNIKAIGSEIALDGDGNIWKWDSYNPIPTVVPELNGTVKLLLDGVFAVKSDGTVWQTNPVTQVPNITNVVGVGLGEAHVCFLTSDGNVWSWDGNTNPTKVSGLSNVKSIAGTFTATSTGETFMAQEGDGSVWTWGNGGILGQGSVTSTATPAKVFPMNLPAIGSLDSPAANSNVGSTVNVSGWYLDGAGVSSIEVYVDGKDMGQAVYGDSRPDVAKAFPTYGNSYAGFHFSFDTGLLNPGQHTITVVENNSNKLTRSFNVLGPLGSIDSPYPNQSVTAGTLPVTGWVLDGRGVDSVEVYVDGKDIAPAHYHDARPDVAKAFPVYNNNNAGYDYGLDTSKLSKGTHTITIKETPISSFTSVTVASRTFSILPAIGCIDTVNDGQVLTGSVNINGWLLDGVGVKQLDVLVDGKEQGPAAYGDARPDVKQVFPIYNNAASGFHYTLDTTKFTAGKHTLVIQDTDLNGNTTNVLSKTFTILPAIACIDTPSSGAVNGPVDVNGWVLDGSGVNSVTLYVDDTSEGTVQLGVQRPDVAKVFPGYKNQNAGFSFKGLDLSKLSYGNHTLKLVETGNNEVQTTVATRTVKVLGPVGCIDSPQNSSAVKGTINIAGWLADGSGVKSLQLSVDGVAATNATVQYGSPRTDVKSVFPQYNNANTGYNVSLDTKVLSDGTHTFKIQETSKNGENYTLNGNFTVNNSNEQWRGSIDVPDNNTVNGTLVVNGWFMDENSISKVDILVNGTTAGTAVIGDSRPDVYAAFKNLPYDSQNAGFHYGLDTTTLANGTYNLEVIATNSKGIQISMNKTVTINNLAAIGCIDSPVNGYTTTGGTLNVTGWMLDGSGVAKVDVLLDGVQSGTATLGGARPDVLKAFPAYHNQNSGFNYNLNLSGLSTGNHTLSVVETGKNGSQLTLQRNIVIK